MVDLPIELWHLIFDYLQLTDLASCAQVSKAFYFAMTEYRIREISFTRRVYQWFHYQTPISDHKHRVDFRHASILRRSSFNFDYLKRLKIGRSSTIDDLGVINRFVQLEELDIDLKNYQNEESRTLSLANLKVLYVFILESIPFVVELDTPRLAKVRTFSLKKLKFIYPRSVRCIHTCNHCGKLPMFQKLEFLTFTDYYKEMDIFKLSSENLKGFRATSLKKLKEVGFYYYNLYLDSDIWGGFKKVTSNLLRLKRPDLKVFWKAVQMTDVDLLNEYEDMADDLIIFQLKHFEKLKDRDDFLWNYWWNGTISLLLEFGFDPRSEESFLKFFSKYVFRTILVFDDSSSLDREEEELLIEIIGRSPSLLSLEFSFCKVSQSFFDQMAETVRRYAIPLRTLQFRNLVIRDFIGSLNFEFVFKLSHLELLETDCQLPDDLILRLLRLPLLDEIEFPSPRPLVPFDIPGTSPKKCRIERLSSNRFLLNKKPLSLQELLELIDSKSNSKPDSIESTVPPTVESSTMLKKFQPAETRCGVM